MKHTSSERGVVLPALIAVIVVVLIAVAGLAAYNLSKSHHKNVQAVETSPSPSTTPSPTASSTPANEFAVSQLGFEMTLPTGLAGLTYAVQTNYPATGDSTASFTTTSLEQAVSGNSCDAADGPIGRIMRSSENPSSGTNVDVVKLATFYLSFTTPQQPCASASAGGQLETSQIQLLRQAFDTSTAL